jgi:hypothetical protein
MMVPTGQESVLVELTYSTVDGVVAPFEGYIVTNVISSRQPGQDMRKTSTSNNLPHHGHGDETDSTHDVPAIHIHQKSQ